MSHVYVYSTLASDVNYTNYSHNLTDLPVMQDGILIQGGAGVMPRKRDDTPVGVMTKITQEQYDLLKQNKVFQAHMDAGHITVEDKKTDPEVVAADMTTRDVSAPKVPGDFKEGKAPKVDAK